MNLNVFALSIAFLTISVLISCTPEKVYSKKILLPESTWSYSNPLQYTWTVQDTTLWYSMLLIIDHVPDLDYQNLYVKCRTTFHDTIEKEQVLSLELFTNSGKPMGECDVFECKTTIEFLPKTKFQYLGDYVLSMEQFGRDSSIRGIQNIELRINRILE
jgi:gliding motility-associated lipoprotein GldH